MKKLKEAILVIMILVLGSDGKVQGEPLSDGINKKQFNIVTVTRNKTSKYDEPLLLNEIFVLFKNIDIMLGGGCFDEKYSEGVFKFINNLYATNLMNVATKKKSNQHMSEYYSLLYSKLINTEKERRGISKLLNNPQENSLELIQVKFRNIFFSMNQRLNKKISATQISDCNFNNHTLLIFQEAIFSQTHLLNDEYVNFIIELCQKLTLSHNVSISLNLLHQFDKNKYPSWIKSIDSEEKDVNSTKPDTKTTVANYSLIISNGQIVNVYIKTEHDDTLQEGNDDLLIKEKFKLKKGNLKSQDLLTEVSLKELIETRICADLNLLRCRNVRKLNSSGILIIQSNTFSLANIVTLLNELKFHNECAFNSYLNKIIVHCDPGNGSSVFNIIENANNNIDIYAYMPISPKWPLYDDELKIRTNSGIKVDVNNEDCDEKYNSKLFFINVWPCLGEQNASYRFTSRDL